jgi:hypothetical protein
MENQYESGADSGVSSLSFTIFPLSFSLYLLLLVEGIW